MILTHKQIREGDLIPRFYGVAYQDFIHSTIVCYPYPFNIVVQYWRKRWMALRYYHKENPLETQALATLNKQTNELKEQAHLKGFDEGKRKYGYDIHDLRKAKKEGYGQGWIDYETKLMEEVDKGKNKQ